MSLLTGRLHLIQSTVFTAAKREHGAPAERKLQQSAVFTAAKWERGASAARWQHFLSPPYNVNTAIVIAYCYPTTAVTAVTYYYYYLYHYY